jgi:DNA-binding MarR family transcriptional regulator
MTTVPAAYAEFGQTLAFTERTMTAVLRDHLAQRDVEPETWYALKLVAVGGPHVARSSLIGDLEGSRGLDADSTRALLARLAADGLIAGDDAVDLTDHGAALFENLRDHVLGATADLLDHLDLRDVETTVRTLKAITRRSQEGARTGHAGSGAGPSMFPPSVVVSPSKSATVTVSAE